MNKTLFPIIVINWVLSASLLAQPLEITVEGTVNVPQVKRFGMNLSHTWWDAGAIARKTAVCNFEGSNYRSIFWGPRQDEGGLFSWQGLSGIPEDFQLRERYVGARFTILNGPGKGITGTITGFEQRPYNDGHSERTLEYLIFDREVPANPSSNAAVLIEKAMLDEGHFNIVGGGSSSYWSSPDLQLVQGDVAPESFGVTALRMDGSTSPSYLRLQGMNTEHGAYVGAWEVRFRAKALSGEPEIALTEPARDATTIAPQWQSYRFQFEVPAGYSQETLFARLETTGGVLLIDDIVFENRSGSNPTAFTDAFVAEIKQLNPGILRYLNMGGSTLRNHLSPPLEQFRHTSSPWQKGGPTGVQFNFPFSLHEFYELCAYVGADPWFSLPGTLTVEEMEAFMEYAGAPAGLELSNLRAQLGQEQPWSEVFDTIYVEMGNEAWNSWGPFAAGGYNGPEYWQERFSAAKNSPWYEPGVFQMVAAGQNFAGHLNRTIMGNAPAADLFAIAPYMLQKVTVPLEERLSGDSVATYEWLFGHTQYRLRHDQGMRMNHEAARANQMELAVYETNHHASHGDGSSEFRNEFMTSLGGGLNTLQNMLIMLQEHGARSQCFFTMFGVTNNAYEVKDVRLFGTVLKLTNTEVRRRPHYLALMMVNDVLSGDLHNVTYGGTMPTFEASYYDSRSNEWGEPKTFDAFQALPLVDGSQRAMILLNTSVLEPVDIVLNLDSEPLGQRATWQMLTSDDINADNELEHSEPQITIQSGTLEDFSNGHRMTIPPHSLVTLKWQSTMR